MRSLATSAIALTFLSVVGAETSLWIPDTDPQPVSAGVLGVGNDGRTTWAIQQGTPTGTFTDPADFGLFPGTATLVEGPNDAVLSAAVPAQGADPAIAVAMSCTINNGMAVCVDVLSEGSTVSTDTETETVSPILIQLGSPASGSGASAPGPTSVAVSGSQTQSSGSQASAGSSPTSSGAQATGTGGGSSGAGRHQISGGLLGLGIIVGGLMSCVL